MSLRRTSFGSLTVIVLAGQVAAQSSPGANHYLRLGQARDAFQQRRFAEAADTYRDLAAAFPADGELWLDYALAADSAGRLAETLTALEKVVDLGAGYRPDATVKLVNLGLALQPGAAYRLAEGHARLGHKSAALSWLGKSLGYGYTPRTEIQTDSAFSGYLNDPAFRTVAGLPPAGARPSREARWRYDIEFLVAEARRLHASFKREAFGAEFRRTATGIEARIARLTDDQIRTELQRLIALLHDGHSIIERFGDGHWLPIQLYWFSDGLFIIDGDGDARSLIGSRVLGIGPLDATELETRLRAYVSRDNPMGIRWMGPAYLDMVDYLHAMGATTDPKRATLRIGTPTGSEREVTLTAGPFRFRNKLAPPGRDTTDAPLYLRRVGRPHWLTRLPDAPAVYAQFNQVMNSEQQTVAQFASELRAAVQDPVVRTLILDLRHNNGGNSYLYPPLLRVLAAFQEASADHQIYVLIGRNTFSAAQNFSTNVDRLTNAIFVGEPTGSSPKFTGEGQIWFELPYSRLRASISNWYHQFTFWGDTRLWIAPDVPVTLSSADYFAGKDPALEAVLELIRGEQR